VAEVGPGDEVIVPSYTFAATASAFLRTGADIVFCEIDPSTMNIDIEDVQRRITPRTRVIVPVHYGGIGADMDGLSRLIEGTDIILIEDAAQGLESRIGTRWLGTIAPMGTISFHETKNLHAGLCGALFLNDASLFGRAEDMWERGTNRTKMLRGVVDKYTWVEPGSSFYPSELQAAFLFAQLEHIDQSHSERQPLYEAYDRRLRPSSDLLPFSVPEVPLDRTLNAHSYFITADTYDTAERIREGLHGRGVSAYIGYVPLHSSPMGRRLGYSADDLPVTEEAARRVLRMPLHNSMTVEDVEFVADAIEDILT
ncbi:dTDP-4-amino-4,6-dideoxygalactose transaminase, partial [hydrothermal vent metagenome]